MSGEAVGGDALARRERRAGPRRLPPIPRRHSPLKPWVSMMNSTEPVMASFTGMSRSL